MSHFPVIEVQELSVALGGRSALTGVTLTACTGDLIGLMGPNGAGKTTLLRAILGLVRPNTGVVRIGQRPLRRGRVPIGYVPQRHEFTWDFPISVEDAVMTGRSGLLGLIRRPGATDWRAVDTALDRVELTQLRQRPVAELSGGQRQRVLVARALALGSKALLLDEPFTGLDIPTQDTLADLIASLAADGTAVIMATHDLGPALASCHRIILINRRITAMGTPAELGNDLPAWMRTFGVNENSHLITTVTASVTRVPV